MCQANPKTKTSSCSQTQEANSLLAEHWQESLNPGEGGQGKEEAGCREAKAQAKAKQQSTWDYLTAWTGHSESELSVHGLAVRSHLLEEMDHPGFLCLNRDIAFWQRVYNPTCFGTIRT